MTNNRYNTPDEGTLDWHIPLNENFSQLDSDVELRDTESNRGSYSPEIGAKFFATDSGATYVGDGSNWNLVGYATRAGGGGLGHYVTYADGISDREINRFYFGSDESFEITRASFPMRGVSAGTTDTNVKLRIYEGGTSGTLLLELDGNEFTSAESDSSAPWIASSAPVTVTVSNSSGGGVDVIPKVWTNIRR
jgi:hypothetical protein